MSQPHATIVNNYWSTMLMSMVIEFSAPDGRRRHYLMSAEALDAIYRDDAEQSYRDIFEKYKTEILDVSRRHITQHVLQATTGKEKSADTPARAATAHRTARNRPLPGSTWKTTAYPAPGKRLN